MRSIFILLSACVVFSGDDAFVLRVPAEVHAKAAMLAKMRDVQSELQLSEQQVETVKQLFNDMHVQSIFAKRNVFDPNRIFAVLDATQVNRLMQLAYQYEISSLGFARVIRECPLGRDLGLLPHEQEHICKKVSLLEATAAASIARILEDLQADVVDELPVHERGKVSRKLGRVFFFQDDRLNANKWRRASE